MNFQKATEHKKQISRAVYGLLFIMICVFSVFVIVLEFQEEEVEQLERKANDYHLATSEKCLGLINSIDKTRLRLQDHYIKQQERIISPESDKLISPIQMGLSMYDQTASLKHEVDLFVRKVDLLQIEYADAEYDELVLILRQSQKKFHADLKRVSINETYSYQSLEDLLAPLISITHQLQRLHNNSYKDSHQLIDDVNQTNQSRLIGLVLLLAIISILGVSRMLRHVRNTLSDLTEAQKSLQSQARIIDQIHDSVISTDLQGDILAWNKGSEILFGYTKEEVEGKHVSIIYPEEEHDFTESQLIVPLKEKGTNEINAKLVRKSGNVFYALVSLSLRYDELGNAIGMIAYTIDISKRVQAEKELKEVNESLERRVQERTQALEKSLLLLEDENTHRKQAETSYRLAKEQAEQANAAKSEFLSQMSHELRTPMNAILGFGQLLDLDSEVLTESHHANVKDILDAGYHLLDLINKLLDLTKIEAGQLEILIEKMDVNEVLQQCISLMQPEVNSHDLKLVDNVSGKNYCIEADTTRFKEVLLNLLSNAVKYNRQHGHITLESKIIKDQYLRICIVDEGHGITKDDIAKLFTSFERLDKGNNVEGTGIGLVISRHLMELMGGSLGVDSTPGEGSVFWMEFLLVK